VLFCLDLDVLASFPHDLNHENDVSDRSQRACARTARKGISYPLCAKLRSEQISLWLYRSEVMDLCLFGLMIEVYRDNRHDASAAIRDPMWARRLLDYLQGEIGGNVGYCNPPALLAKGTESILFHFSLRNVSPAYTGPLVLRLALPDADPAGIAVTHLFQNFVAERGMQAPMVLVSQLDDSAIGAPFLIMHELGPRRSRVRAMAMRLLRKFHIRPAVNRLILTRELRIARLLARLHSIDATGLRERIQQLGIPAKRLALLWDREVEAALYIERWGIDWMGPLMRWLMANRPAGAGEAVCHGDPNGGNIVFFAGEEAAIYDWTGGHIGHPEYDVALLCANWRLRFSPLAGAENQVRAILLAYREYRPVDAARLAYYEAAYLVCLVASIANRAELTARGSSLSHNPCLNELGQAERILVCLEQLTGIKVSMPHRGFAS
jgi:aminoglycoside phosphotransferase (APT) family kinase protein